MPTLDPALEAQVRQIAYAARTKSLAVFIGAGLSTGLPDWANFVAFMYSELGLTQDEEKPDDLADIAEWYASKTGDTTTLNNHLAKLGVAPASDQIAVHRMLVRLGVRTFWTTNFDLYIETAIEQEVGVESLVVQSHKDLVRLDPVKPTVFKLHGTVSGDISKVVLSRDQFEVSFLERRLLLDYLVYYLQTHHFLFLGLSFRDPDLDYVRLILRSMYGRFSTPRPHFFAMRERPRRESEEETHFEQRHRRFVYWTQQMEQYGFHYTPLSDFSEVPTVVRRILETVCTPLPYSFTVKAHLVDQRPRHMQILRTPQQSPGPLRFEFKDELVRFYIGLSLVAPEPIDWVMLSGLNWKWDDAEWAQQIDQNSIKQTYSDRRYFFHCLIGAITYEAAVTREGDHLKWEPRYDLAAQIESETGVIAKAVELGKVKKYAFLNACNHWMSEAASAHVYPDYGRLWHPIPLSSEGHVEQIVLKPAIDDRADAENFWVDLLGSPELTISFRVEARFLKQVVGFSMRWSGEHEGFEITSSDPANALAYWLEYPAARDTARPYFPKD